MSNTTSDLIRVAGFENDSITDGPGLRFVLFVQGCPRSCVGCHNPESIPIEAGQWFSVSEIMQRIDKNPLLTGVTFSGGEPLLQAKALIPLAKMIRQAQLDLAIYTGYTFEELVKRDNPDIWELLSFADVLIDGPFIIKQKKLALRFRGSENQRLLDLPQSLMKKEAVLTTDPDWI